MEHRLLEQLKKQIVIVNIYFLLKYVIELNSILQQILKFSSHI